MSVLSIQQADVSRILQSNYAKWFIRGINLLLVIWLASLLASLTWDLVPPQGDKSLENMDSGLLPVVTDPNAQLIRQLPGWHLMGEAAKKQAPMAVNTPLDAPDTRLKLVLHGVFASEEPDRARAIIADPKGKEEQYAVGDKLPGNAELSEVYPDRVILQRNGRYETLRLMPDSKSKNRPARRPVTGRTTAKQHEQRIREIRRKIKQAPRTLIQMVRPSPYMGEGGGMIGYSLKPGSEPGLFKEMGLKSGDVVTQINGIKLHTRENGMKALKSIQSGDYVSMTILRDLQELEMNFRMPN